MKERLQYRSCSLVKVMLWVVLLLVPCVGFAQSAASILSKAASIYEEANGITASFAMRTHSEQQQASESMEGTIHMKGDKFVLLTPGTSTWFNGKTQWTYIENTDEVNVSNPTGEELQFTNPALLLRMYKSGFTPFLKGESTAQSGKSAYDVELTPKKKGDILKVELQIEKISSLPVRIAITTKQGVSTTIQISKFKAGVNHPDSFFTFKQSDYPNVEVVDLR